MIFVILSCTVVYINVKSSKYVIGFNATLQIKFTYW